MNDAIPIFRFGTLSGSAALLTTVLLMLGAPFLIITFFITITYSVVPHSLWQKHRGLVWRIPIILTCLLGYGTIIVGVGAEIYALRSATEIFYVPLGMNSSFITLFAGVIFLPLAAFGSIWSLRQSLKEKRSKQT